MRFVAVYRSREDRVGRIRTNKWESTVPVLGTGVSDHADFVPRNRSAVPRGPVPSRGALPRLLCGTFFFRIETDGPARVDSPGVLWNRCSSYKLQNYRYRYRKEHAGSSGRVDGRAGQGRRQGRAGQAAGQAAVRSTLPFGRPTRARDRASPSRPMPRLKPDDTTTATNTTNNNNATTGFVCAGVRLPYTREIRNSTTVYPTNPPTHPPIVRFRSLVCATVARSQPNMPSLVRLSDDVTHTTATTLDHGRTGDSSGGSVGGETSAAVKAAVKAAGTGLRPTAVVEGRPPPTTQTPLPPPPHGCPTVTPTTITTTTMNKPNATASKGKGKSKGNPGAPPPKGQTTLHGFFASSSSSQQPKQKTPHHSKPPPPKPTAVPTAVPTAAAADATHCSTTTQSQNQNQIRRSALRHIVVGKPPRTTAAARTTAVVAAAAVVAAVEEEEDATTLPATATTAVVGVDAATLAAAAAIIATPTTTPTPIAVAAATADATTQSPATGAAATPPLSIMMITTTTTRSNSTTIAAAAPPPPNPVSELRTVRLFSSTARVDTDRNNDDAAAAVPLGNTDNNDMEYTCEDDDDVVVVNNANNKGGASLVVYTPKQQQQPDPSVRHSTTNTTMDYESTEPNISSTTTHNPSEIESSLPHPRRDPQPTARALRPTSSPPTPNLGSNHSNHGTRSNVSEKGPPAPNQQALVQTSTTTCPTPRNEVVPARLLQNSALRETFTERFQSLWRLASGPGGLPEEDFTIVVPPPLFHSASDGAATVSDNANADPDATGFPAWARSALAALIEGNRDSLSDLAASAAQSLQTLCQNESNSQKETRSSSSSSSSRNDSMDSTFDVSLVATQIQLLATRQNYLRKIPPAANLTDIIGESTDPKAAAETSSNGTGGFWRWEVAAFNLLLPADEIVRVKRARAARKRWSLLMTAIAQLLAALNTTDSLLLAVENSNSAPKSSSSSSSKLEASLAQISSAEEKVLKLERDADAHRLADIARQEKASIAQAQKDLEAQIKQKALAEKLLEKERKKEEAVNAKEHKKQIAEQAKLLKKGEAQAIKQAKLEASLAKEKLENDFRKAELDKQQKRLRAFLVPVPVSTASSPPKTDNAVAFSSQSPGEISIKIQSSPNHSHFDAVAFRKLLSRNTNSEHPLPFSKRKTKVFRRYRRPMQTVSVPVMVTVYPEGYEENPFAAVQPYMEQQNVELSNRYKLLSFSEDVRPAYYGTWSKRSSIVLGPKPFAKDTIHLDYECDSEAEWEEGEDGEIGEELRDDDNGDDDPDDKDALDDDEDGWLAAEDDIGENSNGETRVVDQAKMGNLLQSRCDTKATCWIAPLRGQPLTQASSKDTSYPQRIEGITEDDAFDLLDSFDASILQSGSLYLDAFPPELLEEDEPTSTESTTEKGLFITDNESIELFARFVHNCNFGSKEKVVDEFFKTNQSMISKRAHVLRLLDSIADKKRHPLDGVFWQLKPEFLDRFGLDSTSANDTKQESMKMIAMLVHNNSISSKEKLVDEIRTKFESATSSRAEATRILLSIASKEKQTSGSTCWKVHQQVLDELGLSHLTSSSSSDTLPHACNLDRELYSSASLSANSVVEAGLGTHDTRTESLKNTCAKRPSSGSAKLLESFVIKKARQTSCSIITK